MLAIDEHIAGVDEAGRGPLAGPVVAAAVILPSDHGIEGLADSKVLSQLKREHLYRAIIKQALAWSVASVDAKTIDACNILQATLVAMGQAVSELSCVPDAVWVDGRDCPDVAMPCRAIIKGDQTVAVIAAASILAKVTRDRCMREVYDRQFPQYGFRQHKGYGTRRHIQALYQHGPCAIHRLSFRPVALAAAQRVEETRGVEV